MIYVPKCSSNGKFVVAVVVTGFEAYVCNL